MSAPLAGVRVLDLTHFVAGPWCTMLLADLGAEIVKVEPPGGEIGRGMGGVYAAGESAIFLGFNRGKRSVALDLKHRDGLVAARKLAEQADVVVENFRPGTAERLGLGAADLRGRNPRLVYCTVSAFGSEGPYADRPANDPVIQALSGSMAATGKAGGRPVRMGVSLPDLAAGVLAATGILAALHRRADTGVGSLVELNLLDAQLYAQTDLMTATAPPATAGAGMSSAGTTAGTSDSAVERAPEAAAASVQGPYVCADGLFLWLDSAEVAAECVITEPPWSTGEPPATGAATSAASGVDQDRIAALLRTRPRADWLDLLGPERAVPVHGLPDVLPGPPSRTLETDHPVIGPLRQVRTPVTSDPPWPVAATAPPLLGEHTREVLQELAFPEAEIDRMAAQGAVHDGSHRPGPPRHHHTREEHAEEQS